MRKSFNSKSLLSAALLGGLIGLGGTASADLIITEVADPGNDFNARFVEIFNSGPSGVNLTGWNLQRYSNGGTTPSNIDLSSLGTLACGDFLIIAAQQAAWETTHSQPAADLYSTSINGNGDDVYALANGNTSGDIVDVYGVVGVDGTGQSWEYLDGGAERMSSSTTASSTFNQADWSSRFNGTNTFPGDYTPRSWAGSASCGAGPVAAAGNYLLTPPTIDGGSMIDEYGSAATLQTTDTGFGNNSNELNGMFVANDGTNLYVSVSGNVGSGNRLYLVLDPSNVSSGVTNLADTVMTYGEFDDLGNSAGAVVLPSGFEADFAIAYDLAGNLGVGTYSTTSGSYKGSGPYSDGFDAALDNSNTAGVGDTAGFTGDPSTVATGAEFTIPLSQIGSPTNGSDTVGIIAFITNSGSPRFFSNQFLPGLPSGTGNLGNNPADLGASGANYVEYTLGTPPPPANVTIATAFTSGTLGNEIYAAFGTTPNYGGETTPGNWMVSDASGAAVTSVSAFGGGYLLSLDTAGTGDLTSDTLTFNNGTDNAGNGGLFYGIVGLDTLRGAILADADYNPPLNAGSPYLTVRATAVENIIDDFGNDNVFAQSGAFGILLRDSSGFDLPGSVAVGDDLLFTGVYSYFNGVNQISASGGLLSNLGNVGTPAANALDFSTATAADYEAAEGTLVDLSNVTFDNAGATIANQSGAGQNQPIGGASTLVSVFFDRDIVAWDGVVLPSGTGTVSGVLGQFDNTVPGNEGYQVLPLNAPSDLDFGTSVSDWQMLD